MSRGEWEDNIKVMIARGMPVEPQEIPIIVEYLSTYYNRDHPPPPPEQVTEGAASGPLPVAQLVSEQGCGACHAIDKKIVGPSFKEVATRYKGDSAAHASLAKKIREGGAGAWGAIPMPPHPQIADADLERVVDWVLQQQ